MAASLAFCFVAPHAATSRSGAAAVVEPAARSAEGAAERLFAAPQSAAGCSAVSITSLAASRSSSRSRSRFLTSPAQPSPCHRFQPLRTHAVTMTAASAASGYNGYSSRLGTGWSHGGVAPGGSFCHRGQRGQGQGVVTSALSGSGGGSDADLAAAAQSAAAAAGAIPMDSPRQAPSAESLPPLPRLTPYTVLKLAVAAVIALAAGRAVLGAAIGAALHPDVLLRASWLLVVWPWPAAALIAAWTAVTAARGGGKRQALWKQVGVLLGALTWLILVPCGAFQGYLDGWRVTLFTLYAFFFTASAIVRLQLYGDLAPPQQDRQQATTTSKFAQVLFVLSVVGGHWYAAFESASRSALAAAASLASAAAGAAAAGATTAAVTAPLPVAAWVDPWASRLAPVLLLVAVWLQWDAAFFLGKYFDRLVVPRAIVTVGPYRSLRHPLYASYILLFAAFALSLHSYKALLFLVTASFLYYRSRIALEESMLLSAFPEYKQYCDRVPYRLLPFLY